MKTTLKYTIISLASLAGLATLTAEPDKPKPDQATRIGPRHVRVQVEYIEMPLTTMSQLLDDDKATETDTILRARVAELVKNGKADIVETQLVVARSGEKSTVESIREFIYPTEYEPPELPKAIHTSTDGTKTKGYAINMATGPTPTAFETRNLGSTLEIEPTISNNSTCIDLRFAPEIVYHTKNTTYATWKDSRGQSDIVMPEIYTMRLTTAVTLVNGKPSLVGALSPRDDQGHVDYSRKLLVFAKAHIINVK